MAGAVSFAQPGGRTAKEPQIEGAVTGMVIDAVSKQPVEFASVSLFKKSSGKLVNGSITDEKGFFRISGVHPDTYTLSVTFLGYEKLHVDSLTTTPSRPDLNIGRLFMDHAVKTMDEVTVEEEKSTVENRVDKLVFNVEKDISSKGGDATDVLQKVPLLNVDMDGNVTIRGSGGIKVLINGKPSGMMAGSTAEALKAIPADQIKTVEVITNPSAKYDAEGSAGIINIITRDKSLQGISGSINASGGTRMNHLNGNINRRRGRLGLNANAGLRTGVRREGTTDFYREDTYSGYTRTLHQKGAFNPLRQGWNLGVGMDYDFNAYNSISADFKSNRRRFDRTSDVDVTLIDTAQWDYHRYTVNPTLRNGFDLNLEYKRTFKEPGKELSVGAMHDQSYGNENYSLRQAGNSSMFDKNERSVNLESNDETTFQIDYSHPEGKNVMVEVGSKAIYRNLGSDYTYENFSYADDSFLEDTTRSNESLYRQTVYASYLVTSVKVKEKYEFKPGIRYEFTNNEGEFGSGGSFASSYDNIIPSVAIGRTFKNFSSVRLNYSKRLQRPGSSFLNPFVNASDPRNITYGNPYLDPETTDSYELSYSAFSQAANGSVSVFYRNTTNVIQSITDVNSGGISITTYHNLGSSNMLGFSFFGQLTLFKIQTFRGNINLYRIDQSALYNNQQLSNEDIQYNLNLNSTTKLPKDLTLEVFGNFNSPRATLQGKTPSFSMMHVGLNKEILKKKGSVGIRVWQPFQENIVFESELSGEGFYQRSTSNVPFRSYGVTFNYNFGKMEFRQPKKRKKGLGNDDLKNSEGGEF